MKEKEKFSAGERIRLTIRATEELEQLIRGEAEKRGTSINQTMLYILNRYFQGSKEIVPCSLS